MRKILYNSSEAIGKILTDYDTADNCLALYFSDGTSLLFSCEGDDYHDIVPVRHKANLPDYRDLFNLGLITTDEYNEAEANYKAENKRRVEENEMAVYERVKARLEANRKQPSRDPETDFD